MTQIIQPGILADVPSQTCHLCFESRPGTDLAAPLWALSRLADGERGVVGRGEPLLQASVRHIDGLATMPARHAAGWT